MLRSRAWCLLFVPMPFTLEKSGNRTTSSALTQCQNVFAALNIHTHCGQHALIAEPHAIEVDDQQFDLIEAARRRIRRLRISLSFKSRSCSAARVRSNGIASAVKSGIGCSRDYTSSGSSDFPLTA